MAEFTQVAVAGLSELRSDLRAFDTKLPRAIARAHQTVSKLVAEHARAAADGRPGVAPKAGRSIKGGGTQTYAYVRGGGSSAPYFFGAEFGSVRFKQFPAWRGSGSDAGYFLWPTIRRDLPMVMGLYGDCLDDALRGTAVIG